MEPVKHKYSNIDYAKESVIEQIHKHFKNTDQRILDEIVYSIESITKSMESIQENHVMFLKVNEALALYVVEIEEKRKEKTYKESMAIENLEEKLRKLQENLEEKSLEASEDDV